MEGHLLKKFGIGIGIAIAVVSLVMGGARMAAADFHMTATQTTNYTDIFGAVVLTTQLTENFNYACSWTSCYEITWYQTPPTFTLTKPWWLIWADPSDVHSNNVVLNPGWENEAYGSGHWNYGIPTPWGAMGFQSDFDSIIYYYGDGSYTGTSGMSYIA